MDPLPPAPIEAETRGTRIARENRRRFNALTPEQRAYYLERAMQIIRQGRTPAVDTLRSE